MLQILTTFHCALISLLFQVESHVLIAVEGGPVLLQITLTYKGTRDILVDNISDKHYGAIPPKEWGSWLARRPHPFFIVGQTTMSIRPGAKIVCIVSPTDGLVCQPKAGVCDIKAVGCFVLVAPGKGLDSRVLGRIILPTLTVRVTVEPFTREAQLKLSTMIKEILSRLASGTLTLDQAWMQRNILDVLVANLPPSLSSSAIDILASKPEQWTRQRVRERLWQSSEGARHLHDWDLSTLKFGKHDQWILYELFDDYVARESSYLDNAFIIRRSLYFWLLRTGKLTWVGRPIYPDELDHIVSILRWPQQKLPDAHLRAISELKPLWLRAFVYVTFAGRLPLEWRTAFLKEIEDRVRPLPKEQVQKWIEDLGSEDFKEREQASAKLEESLDRVAKPLQDALRGLNPEASKRAVLLLKKTESIRPRELYEAAFFEWIKSGSQGSRSRDRILKVIAAGDPAIPFVQDAKKALAAP